MKWLVALVLLLSSVGLADAQAFGLHGGMKLDELKAEPLPGTTAWLYTITPPQPNPIFDKYLGVISRKYGLCSITASREQKHRDLGDVQQQLVGLLVAKYGLPQGTSTEMDFPDLPAGLALVRLIFLRDGGDLSLIYTFEGNEQCSSLDQEVTSDGL